MWSGTTFRNSSGKIVGVHQKIDRIARRHVKKYIPAGVTFPTSKQILHFEGNNGPDGIKRKSPSKDEPWHYIDPTKPDDRVLVELINDHMHNLTVSLAGKNEERAAYEAAWLAHAVVDGLTPAHHFPLAEKIEELWGKPHHERVTVKDKAMIKGTNRRDTLKKNWEYWGVGGVFSAHVAFEWGVASAIAPMKFRDIGLTKARLKDVEKRGFEVVFLEMVHTINNMNLYETFQEKGWTRALADRTRRTLVPRISRTVALGWYYAALQARGES
jgi:hypothetical protein